jgi:hypothetical protein
MSAVNSVGNMVTPNHQLLYLVKSAELEEAKARGGAFNATLSKRIRGPNPTSAGNYSGLATFHPGSASKSFSVTISDPASVGNEVRQIWTIWEDMVELQKWEDEKVDLAEDNGKFPYMDILSEATAKRYHDHTQSLAIPRCSPFEISANLPPVTGYLLGWVMPYFFYFLTR